MSASWCSVTVCSKEIIFFSTKSHIYWRRMSICLILECCTKFLDMYFYCHNIQPLSPGQSYNPVTFVSSIKVVCNGSLQQYIPPKQSTERSKSAFWYVKQPGCCQQINTLQTCFSYHPHNLLSLHLNNQRYWCWLVKMPYTILSCPTDILHYPLDNSIMWFFWLWLVPSTDTNIGGNFQFARCEIH